MTMCNYNMKYGAATVKKEAYWFSDSVPIFLCVDHGKKKRVAFGYPLYAFRK